MYNRNFFIRKSCPVCEANNFRVIYQNRFDEEPIKGYLKSFYESQGRVEFEYLVEANYILCECKDCGLIFQRDIPNDILMERLYEHWINPQKVLDQHLQQDGLGYYSNYAQEIMQIMAFIGKNPSSLSLFDFGMGWGKWAIMAKAFGCDSYGAEISFDRIEYAKANGIKIITWEEIPQQRYDFINTEQVFEHIPEPLQTLRHLKMALKTDGIIKISVPNTNDIERRLKNMDWKAPKGSRNSLNPVAPLEHVNCFRRATLEKMASEAGMKEVFIPIKMQYKFSTNWSNPKNIARNIFRPISRNLLKNKNYILLHKITE